MGQEVPGGVGDMVGHFAGFHADVDVEPEDEVTSGGFLQFVDDLVIAGMVGDQLAFPVAEGVGA